MSATCPAAPSQHSPAARCIGCGPGRRPAARRSQPAGVPAGFDVAGFERNAKAQFLALQAANDARDLERLRDYLTPEMFEVVRADIAERGDGARSTPRCSAWRRRCWTVARRPDRYVVSVRFTGSVRDQPGAVPEELDEVWHLTKPRAGAAAGSSPASSRRRLIPGAGPARLCGPAPAHGRAHSAHGSALNYRHLYYFWVVAKEGGMARAAERLDMAVQTVSAQVRALEQSLGHALFKPAGRGIVLTEAGVAAMALADQIFQLGEQLPAAVRDAATGQGQRLAVGISDGLPKLVVRHLLQPAVESTRRAPAVPRRRIRSPARRPGAAPAGRGAVGPRRPPNPNLRLYSHALGDAPLAWFAPAALGQEVQPPFPPCLADLPVLLPTGHAAVRPRLDQWFERQGFRPRIAGEFEDSALLVTFGRSGMGAFPASHWSRAELLADRNLRLLGDTPELVEHFFLISAERRIHHPLVQKLVHAPR